MGCALEEKSCPTTLNAQPATLFAATHFGWTVKIVYYSPLTARHSLPFHQSLFAVHYSLFANRQSLSFRLGRSLALPFFSSRVPSPSSRSKSALMFPCHQLRTEVCFGCKRAGVQRYEGAIRQAILHATGFSQWLMTGFNERRIHSAIILDGASLDAPKIFWQCGSTALQKNCSPLAALTKSPKFPLHSQAFQPFHRPQLSRRGSERCVGSALQCLVRG